MTSMIGGFVQDLAAFGSVLMFAVTLAVWGDVFLSIL